MLSTGIAQISLSGLITVPFLLEYVGGYANHVANLVRFALLFVHASFWFL